MKFTTKDLQARLLKSLNEGSIPERNSVARIASAMIATRQLEIHAAGTTTQPVTLFDDTAAA